MDLAPNWKRLRIGEVCKVGDGAHGSLKRVDSTGVMYLTSKNFKEGGLDLASLDRISQDTYEKHFRANSKALTRPQVDDVLFSIIGTIGEPYLVRINDVFGLSSSVAILRPDIREILPSFLFHWIKGNVFQDALYGIKGGVAQGYVSLEMIRSLPLYLPPIETQRKIAAILSAYDDLIENNARRIKLLEQAAHNLYREWFVEFRFPGHEQVPSESSLPEGWRSSNIGEIAFQKRDSVNPDVIEPDTPYVGLEHIPRKSIALSEWGRAGDTISTKLIFQSGDVLFGKIRPYLHKVAVAPIDGVASSDAIVIAPRSPEYYGLMVIAVSTDDFVANATQSSQGTQMPRANWDVLTRYPIVVPTANILSEFDNFVRDIIEQIQNLTFRNANLRQTCDLLLPRLVSGEVDVNELEIEVKA